MLMNEGWMRLSHEFFFKKMGQSRPLFVYFHSLLITILIQIEKSIDGTLGFEPGAAGWQTQTKPRSCGGHELTTFEKFNKLIALICRQFKIKSLRLSIGYNFSCVIYCGHVSLAVKQYMLSLYCKAIKLLPRTVDVLSILILLCRSYAPLLLILWLSIARPFQK